MCLHMHRLALSRTMATHLRFHTHMRSHSHTISLFLTHAGLSHDPPSGPRAKEFKPKPFFFFTQRLKISSDLLIPL